MRLIICGCLAILLSAETADARIFRHRRLKTFTQQQQSQPQLPLSAATPQDNLDPTDLAELESKLLEAVNIERAKFGLSALSLDSGLLARVRTHCQWMARNRSMTHTTYPCIENIAMGNLTVAATIRQWMHSPGHKANILNHRITAFASSRALSSSGVPYWCQQFK